MTYRIIESPTGTYRIIRAEGRTFIVRIDPPPPQPAIPPVHDIPHNHAAH